MTEFMFRLIKGNKIVGFEWHLKGDILHSQSLCEFPGRWLRAQNYNYIQHDYKELGVKVGDEWWFIEGDVIEFDDVAALPEQRRIRGLPTLDHWALTVLAAMDVYDICEVMRASPKLVGNIHEEKDNDKGND
jgi:hypothetical protein